MGPLCLNVHKRLWGKYMNQHLAEQILTQVLGWEIKEARENVRLLEEFAELKYDQYQQYEAGNRFMENLAIWLNQFQSEEEKRVAFDFVKNHLVFISEAEMRHLICSIYPDYMIPIMKKEAKEIYKKYQGTEEISAKDIVQTISRQSLFLGLSDGARLDVFRRSDTRISHEQVSISYEIPEKKFGKILEKMRKDTSSFYQTYAEIPMEPSKLYGIYLLDDFSGSGISYLRLEEDPVTKQSVWDGKINKVICELQKVLADGCSLQEIPIYLFLYLATDAAKKHIEESMQKYRQQYGIDIHVCVLQKIHKYIPNEAEEQLMKKYYAKNKVEDSHYYKGKHDFPYLGFDECSLPLVIYHNTPNNSFTILWAANPSLFPRVTRHKDVN